MKNRILTLLPIALLFACAPLSADRFLHAYERGVGGGVGGDANATPDTVNWTVLATASAVPLTFPHVSGQPGFSAVSEGPGSSAYPDLSTIQDNPGFLYFSGGNGEPAPQVFFAFNETLTTTTTSVVKNSGDMQTSWLTDASFPMTSITFGDLLSLSVYTNPRNISEKVHHFAIKIASGWVVADTAFSPTATNWSNFFQLADPQSATWLGGFYDPVAETLATSLAGLSTVSITADTPVLGYGMVVFTGSLSGDNGSWVRLDDYLVTAVPEPAVYAAVLAGLALLVVVARRRARA